MVSPMKGTPRIGRHQVWGYYPAYQWESTRGLTLDDAVEMMRGEPGTGAYWVYRK